MTDFDCIFGKKKNPPYIIDKSKEGRGAAGRDSGVLRLGVPFSFFFARIAQQSLGLQTPKLTRRVRGGKGPPTA
jgi:hypothetical protein